jgi:maltose O-acetyltransferase
MSSSRLWDLVIGETEAIHPRLIMLRMRSAFISRAAAPLYNARLLREAGFPVGDRTTVLGLPRITGSWPQKNDSSRRGLFLNLILGSDVVIDVDTVLDLEERISVGDRVLIGAQVMILTSTHELGPKERRAGPVTRSPVVIENGVWIGARSVILPGVTIGEGAVVNPGSVVNKDVPPNTRVGGIPAKKIEAFETPG